MKKAKSAIDLKMKASIGVLALLMPVAGFLSGWYYSLFVINSNYNLFWALLFFIVGIVLDAVCINGKVFSFVFYKMPIPIVLTIISYEVALFFTTRMYAIAIGCCGMALGVLIDVVLLSPKPFYLARKRVLIIVYVFMSILLLGIMLGVPVSNFLLGILAGNYYSLRYAGTVLSKKRLRKNLHAVSTFATAVLLLSELIFGWLIWKDSANIIDYISQIARVQLTTGSLLTLMLVFGSLSVALQYFITYWTSKTMYKYREAKLSYAKGVATVSSK